MNGWPSGIASNAICVALRRVDAAMSDWRRPAESLTTVVDAGAVGVHRHQIRSPRSKTIFDPSGTSRLDVAARRGVRRHLGDAGAVQVHRHDRRGRSVRRPVVAAEDDLRARSARSAGACAVVVAVRAQGRSAGSGRCRSPSMIQIWLSVAVVAVERRSSSRRGRMPGCSRRVASRCAGRQLRLAGAVLVHDPDLARRVRGLRVAREDDLLAVRRIGRSEVVVDRRRQLDPVRAVRRRSRRCRSFDSRGSAGPRRRRSCRSCPETPRERPARRSVPPSSAVQCEKPQPSTHPIPPDRPSPERGVRCFRSDRPYTGAHENARGVARLLPLRLERHRDRVASPSDRGRR